MTRTITISPDAEQDIEEHWIYGYRRFGRQQADHYMQFLYTLFYRLADQNIGRKRADIGHDIFSIPCKQHMVFYRIAPDKLIIVRVLHHSRDVTHHQHWTLFF
jgi:toxin ParE1/3/4